MSDMEKDWGLEGEEDGGVGVPQCFLLGQFIMKHVAELAGASIP